MAVYKFFRYVILALILGASNVFSSELESEGVFDARFLSESADYIDFFTLDREFLVGSYDVDLYINNEYINNSRLVIDNHEYVESELCLEGSLLVGVDLKFLSDVKDLKSGCYFINKDPYSSLYFDTQELVLKLSIPQMYMNNDPQKDSEWDFGTSAIRAVYDLRASKSNKGEDLVYSNLDVKVNHGRWFGEFGGVFDQRNSTLSYGKLSTPINSLKSSFTFGQSWTKSEINTNFGFLGLQLSSEQSMKDMSLIGYAPIITGVAEELSTIKIVQSGITIFQERLPIGPYVISDINPVSNGDIFITVEGDSGRKRIERLSMSILPDMKRTGDFDYDLAIGYRNLGIGNISEGFDEKDLFVSGSYSLGLNSYTVMTSSIASKDYYQIGGQLVKPLGDLGTLGFTISTSTSRSIDGWDSGYSLKAKYAKNISQSTDLNLLSFRYNDKDYIEFSDYNSSYQSYNSKEKYEAMISSRLTNGTFSQSMWAESTWDGLDYYGLSLSASFYLGETVLNLTTNYRSNDIFDISLSLNIPIGSLNGDSFSLSSSYNNSNELITSASVYHGIGEESSISGMLTQSNRSRSFSLSSSHRSKYLNYNGSIAGRADNSYTIQGNVNGSILYTENTGLLFSRNSTNTIALIRMNNLDNVKINDGETNQNGVAMVSLQPYKENTIDVDLNRLPRNVELIDNSILVHPSNNSVIYRDIYYNEVRKYNIYITESAMSLGYSDFDIVDSYGNNIGHSYKGIVMATIKGDSEFIYLVRDGEYFCEIEISDLEPNVDVVYDRECRL
ncbi:fimbria/pilus outer membrane usher protein [Vibrio brasiliensis]